MNLLCSEWVSVHLAQKRNHNRYRARHRAQYRAHLKSLQKSGIVLW